MSTTAPDAHPAVQDYRYEIKLTSHEANLPVVRTWVWSHPAGFRRAYPPRRVNSIYLDTHGWTNLEDNLAGVAQRGKLRVRWYGDDLSAVQGVLEFKQKRGRVGRKVAWACPEPIDLTTSTWREVLAQLRRQVSGPLATLLAVHTCPTLINRYRRCYYLSADALVRVTLDTEIDVLDQTLSPRPNLSRFTLRPPMLVVEFKTDAAHADRVATIVGAFPLRTSAHSKYANSLLDSMMA